NENGHLEEYPVHFWDELFSQSPRFRNQFSSYKQYGMATMTSLLKPYDTTGMQILTSVHSETSYFENNGDGTFKVRSLPTLVQIAPVNGIIVTDVDGDGNHDLLMTGNDYGNEVFSGRFDACMGHVLLGDGSGNFTYRSGTSSG